MEFAGFTRIVFFSKPSRSIFGNINMNKYWRKIRVVQISMQTAVMEYSSTNLFINKILSQSQGRFTRPLGPVLRAGGQK
jgi:hypothetical protein